MKILLYLIALLWISIGAFLVVFTEKARDFFRRALAARNMKAMAAIAFVCGLILIIGAFFQERGFWLTLILGLLAVAKGVYFYWAPQEQSKALMDWWFYGTTPETARFMGLVLFVLGIALFSYLR